MTFVRSIDANIPFRAVVIRAYYSPPPLAHPEYSPSLILGTKGSGPGGTWHSLLPGSDEWVDLEHDAINIPLSQIDVLIAQGVLHDVGQTAEGNIKLNVPRPFWVKVLKENIEGGKTKINVEVLEGPTATGPEGSSATAPQNAIPPKDTNPSTTPSDDRDIWLNVRADAEKAWLIADAMDLPEGAQASIAAGILVAKTLRETR